VANNFDVYISSYGKRRILHDQLKEINTTIERAIQTP
jgi:hypothetical protein